MTSEDRVIALWVDANPIRNSDVAELDQSDGSTYLATMTQRSSEMIELDTKPDERKRARPSIWMVAAAAAVVLALGAGSQMLGGGELFGSAVPELLVAFDGENCVYDGPATVGAGDVEFTFHNTGSTTNRLALVELNEGKTALDLTEYMASSGLFGLPPWTAEISAWRQIPAGEMRTRTLNLAPGEIQIVCSIGTPFEGFVGGQLVVTD